METQWAHYGKNEVTTNVKRDAPQTETVWGLDNSFFCDRLKVAAGCLLADEILVECCGEFPFSWRNSNLHAETKNQVPS